MEQLLSTFTGHWPFFCASLAFMVIGQVMKTAVWTRRRAHVKGALQPLFWWAYKTLPLHPVLAGAALGLAVQAPEPDVTMPLSCVYFAGAGALSVWLFDLLKGLAKQRGLVIKIGGD